MELAYCYLPRPAMGPGPWADEPDHGLFSHAGLPCLAVRHPQDGYWCGYVGVSPGHPLHGVEWAPEDGPSLLSDAPGHCGVNWSDGPARPGSLLHVPEFADAWWFGMDCAHGMDVNPARDYQLRDHPDWQLLRDFTQRLTVYRDLSYLQSHLRQLAEWLAERA